jgi:hypothetical protein
MTKRETDLEAIRARLAEWTTEIERIEARAHAANTDAKARYEAALVEMRRQRDKALDRLHQAQNASEETWATLQEGVELAWENALHAFREAADRVK